MEQKRITKKGKFQGRTPNSEVQEFGVRPWNSFFVPSGFLLSTVVALE